MAGLLRRAAFRGPLLRSSRLSTTPFLRSSLSTLSSHQADDVIDLTTKAAELNVRMTTAEMDSLLAELDSSGDGLLQRSEVEVVGRAKLEERWTRDVLLAAIEKPRSALDHLGTKLVTSLDYFGTALFACVGVQIAGGEAGMNLVGCTLIGCVAAMGGGTVNNLLYGAAHPDGVFWVRSPSFLFVALTVSVLTFFAWPMYCEHQAAQELKTARDTLKALAKAEEAEGKSKSSRLGKAQLSRRSSVELLETNPDFHQRACQVLGLHPKTTSAYEIFRRMDTDQSGHIELEEMCNLVQKGFDQSAYVYAADTMSLAAISVVAVNGAIGRGLHPLVAATSGVTICFGGIFRDVLCGRDLAIGGQSYAMATGAGACVYVSLRELALKGVPLPLAARIVLSGGSVVALRAYEWLTKQPLLKPMYDGTHHGQHGGKKRLEESAWDRVKGGDGGGVHS